MLLGDVEGCHDEVVPLRLIPPGDLPEVSRRPVNALFSSILHPAASADPIHNGDLVFQATSNTTLTFKYRGDDGVVRSGSITLS
jgi:hypothetical protein